MKRNILNLALLVLSLSLLLCACGNETTTETKSTETKAVATSAAHVHFFSSWETVKKATCTDTGLEERTCACGEKETKQVSLTPVHSYGEWKTVTEATCTENGSQKRTCSLCGKSETKPTYAKGHTFSAWTITKDATCTEGGVQERICSCGEKETKSASAIGHSFGAWRTTKDATCTEGGVQERICSCGEKETKNVSATGHSWIDASCTDSKKCSVCRISEGSPLGHTTNSGTCSRCNQKMYIAYSCTFVCSDALPETYNSSTYYEYTYGYDVPHSKVKITSMKSSVTSSGNVELYFDCEITYLWKITHVNLSVQIIDPDGYTVATGLISTGGSVTQGSKYRAKVTIYNSELNIAGTYTVKIIED